MSSEFVPSRLDVRAFARAGAILRGQDLLSKRERLYEETGRRGGERELAWEARGELRTDASGSAQVWLHLRVQASLPLTCQRCLGPVDVQIEVDRPFRFVATEEAAAAEDEDAEEDVLVISRDFDLLELIEDELLMALPLVPRHEACPTEVRLAAQDADFVASMEDKPHPFASLAGLKGGKSQDSD